MRVIGWIFVACLRAMHTMWTYEWMCSTAPVVSIFAWCVRWPLLLWYCRTQMAQREVQSHRQLNLKPNTQYQHKLLSRPICAKEDRNSHPVPTKDLVHPILDMVVSFHPAGDTAHWYSIMISTYGGTTSSCSTQIDHWERSVHDSHAAQDGLLLSPKLCPSVRQLVTHGSDQHLLGCTSNQHFSNYSTPGTSPWCLLY